MRTKYRLSTRQGHALPLPSDPPAIYMERMMNRTLPLLALVLSVALFAPDRASAQQYVYYAAPAPQSHAGGFYGRFTLGAAFPYASETIGVDDYAWYGGGVDVGISLGISLPSAFALHVDLLGSVAPQPRVSLNGKEVGSLANLDSTASGFGVGFTRYFPSNAFVTAGLGVGVLSLQSDTTRFQSNAGGYLTVGGGQEWWVGPRFGLGLIGRLTAYRVPDSGTSITSIVPSLSLSMSFD